jgi:hypothetical protein
VEQALARTKGIHVRFPLQGDPFLFTGRSRRLFFTHREIREVTFSSQGDQGDQGGRFSFTGRSGDQGGHFSFTGRSGRSRRLLFFTGDRENPRIALDLDDELVNRSELTLISRLTVCMKIDLPDLSDLSL